MYACVRNSHVRPTQHPPVHTCAFLFLVSVQSARTADALHALVGLPSLYRSPFPVLRWPCPPGNRAASIPGDVAAFCRGNGTHAFWQSEDSLPNDIPWKVQGRPPKPLLIRINGLGGLGGALQHARLGAARAPAHYLYAHCPTTPL